jgi:hypothetical protein
MSDRALSMLSITPFGPSLLWGQHLIEFETMMLSLIRGYTAGAAMAAMLIPTVANAGSIVPRAWLVSKSGAQAVLVGESHVGTPVENDRYFDTVVKPSYVVADVAIMETYFGPEQTRNETFERGAPCFDDPKGMRTQRLRLAFDALISATRDNHLDVPDWLEEWQILPQFLFTSVFFDPFTTKSLGPSYDVAVEAQGGLGISFRLHGKGTAAKKTIGLDTLKDRRTHFCSASAGDRADFVADEALKVVRLLRLRQSDPSYASVGKLAIAGGEAFTETIRCVDQAVPCALNQVSPSARLLLEKGWMLPYSPGSFEISIKKRTLAWVPSIVRTMSEHRRSFVIVGALHLPDLRVGDRVEPGLISLLRQQGFSVTSIGGASDISATFLSPSWGDRMRAALSSL